MESIAKHTFKSPINREYSMGLVTPLSKETTSNCELFKAKNGALFIEWEIPELGETEGIGLWMAEDNDKLIEGYDGVFKVPAQIIEWLKSLGYDTTEIE